MLSVVSNVFKTRPRAPKALGRSVIVLPEPAAVLEGPPVAVLDEPKPAYANPHVQGTPDYYLFEIQRADEMAREPGANPLDCGRLAKYWRDRAADDHIDLAGAQQARMDPFNRLLVNPNLLEHQEKSLLEVKAAMETAQAATATLETVKKKWIALIDLALELQSRARSNVIDFGIYVVRCQEKNTVLRMEPIHIQIFQAWNDPQVPNSLVMIHPGAGKTTLLCVQDLWELCHDTKLRFLKMCQSLEIARKRLSVVRTYAGHARLRALFPHIRLDKDAPDNAGQFTLLRENVGSQDPTMHAAGWSSAIQGAGFDRLDFDDLCDQRVRREVETREKIWTSFFAVALQRRRSYGASGARVRYICTPWHMDDVAARIQNHLRDGKMENWIVVKLPIREDAAGMPIPLLPRPGLAQEIRRIQLTDAVTYSCCYKLDPRDKALRKFQNPRFYDVNGGTDPECPEVLNGIADARGLCAKMLTEINGAEHWWVLDPAAGGRDKTAMVGFALMRGSGKAAITAAKFFESRPTENIKRIVEIIQTTASDHILIEDQAAFGTTIVDFWSQYIYAALGDDYRSRIHTSGSRLSNSSGERIGRNIKKEERFYAAIPYLEDGTVRFPGRWRVEENGISRCRCVDDPDMLALFDQLTHYPAVVRDDAVDCVAMFINYHIGVLVRGVERMRKPVPLAQPVKRVSVLTQMYLERLEILKKRGTQSEEYSERNEEAELFAVA